MKREIEGGVFTICSDKDCLECKENPKVKFVDLKNKIIYLRGLKWIIAMMKKDVFKKETELIEELRLFLVSDIDAGDYNVEYINKHFEVFLKQREELLK
jgi:hypothetical protein